MFEFEPVLACFRVLVKLFILSSLFLLLCILPVNQLLEALWIAFVYEMCYTNKDSWIDLTASARWACTLTWKRSVWKNLRLWAESFTRADHLRCALEFIELHRQLARSKVRFCLCTEQQQVCQLLIGECLTFIHSYMQRTKAHVCCFQLSWLKKQQLFSSS